MSLIPTDSRALQGAFSALLFPAVVLLLSFYLQGTLGYSALTCGMAFPPLPVILHITPEPWPNRQYTATRSPSGAQPASQQQLRYSPPS